MRQEVHIKVIDGKVCAAVISYHGEWAKAPTILYEGSLADVLKEIEFWAEQKIFLVSGVR